MGIVLVLGTHQLWIHKSVDSQITAATARRNAGFLPVPNCRRDMNRTSGLKARLCNLSAVWQIPAIIVAAWNALIVHLNRLRD